MYPLWPRYFARLLCPLNDFQAYSSCRLPTSLRSGRRSLTATKRSMWLGPRPTDCEPTAPRTRLSYSAPSAHSPCSDAPTDPTRRSNKDWAYARRAPQRPASPPGTRSALVSDRQPPSRAQSSFPAHEHMCVGIGSVQRCARESPRGSIRFPQALSRSETSSACHPASSRAPRAARQITRSLVRKSRSGTPQNQRLRSS